MAKSRILAGVLAAVLLLALAAQESTQAQAQTPPTAAPKTEAAPAKETFRTKAWNKISGNWKRVSGSVKERWGRLTHNEIREARGRREALNGYIQARYGIDRETADRQIDEWLKTLK